MIVLDWLILGLSITIVFSLGAAIGSFLNVVIYRIPAKQSLIYPASHCPRCQHSLAAADNIPVLGWLWLQGRCRYCHGAIAPRYPIVEAGTGLVFLVVFLQFDWSVQTVSYWIFFAWLIALALIDWDTLTLPDVLIKPGLVLGLILNPLQAQVATPNPEHLGSAILRAILGAVLGLWLLDVIRLSGSVLLGQEAMGNADPKLAAMIGAWLGPTLLGIAIFMACLLGAIVGSSAIALRFVSRKQPIPFGPFLALGAVLSALWGDTLIHFYLSTFFPLL